MLLLSAHALSEHRQNEIDFDGLIAGERMLSDRGISDRISLRQEDPEPDQRQRSDHRQDALKARCPTPPMQNHARSLLGRTRR